MMLRRQAACVRSCVPVRAHSSALQSTSARPVNRHTSLRTHVLRRGVQGGTGWDDEEFGDVEKERAESDFGAHTSRMSGTREGQGSSSASESTSGSGKMEGTKSALRELIRKAEERQASQSRGMTPRQRLGSVGRRAGFDAGGTREGEEADSGGENLFSIMFKQVDKRQGGSDRGTAFAAVHGEDDPSQRASDLLESLLRPLEGRQAPGSAEIDPCDIPTYHEILDAFFHEFGEVDTPSYKLEVTNVLSDQDKYDALNASESPTREPDFHPHFDTMNSLAEMETEMAEIYADGDYERSDDEIIGDKVWNWPENLLHPFHDLAHFPKSKTMVRGIPADQDPDIDVFVEVDFNDGEVTVMVFNMFGDVIDIETHGIPGKWLMAMKQVKWPTPEHSYQGTHFEGLMIEDSHGLVIPPKKSDYDWNREYTKPSLY